MGKKEFTLTLTLVCYTYYLFCSNVTHRAPTSWFLKYAKASICRWRYMPMPDFGYYNTHTYTYAEANALSKKNHTHCMSSSMTTTTTKSCLAHSYRIMHSYRIVQSYRGAHTHTCTCSGVYSQRIHELKRFSNILCGSLIHLFRIECVFQLCAPMHGTRIYVYACTSSRASLFKRLRLRYRIDVRT